MAIPTNAEIDEAVPVSGTPNRAKTNAVLKNMVASLPIWNAATQAPASVDSPGTKGQYFVDDEYWYVCVADNSWRRTGLVEW